MSTDVAIAMHNISYSVPFFWVDDFYITGKILVSSCLFNAAIFFYSGGGNTFSVIRVCVNTIAFACLGPSEAILISRSSNHIQGCGMGVYSERRWVVESRAF